MYPFSAHSESPYLTDRERPGGVLAFDGQEGWVDFVTEVTRGERLWEGARGDEGREEHASGAPAVARAA
jgi:hypothetical protein